MPEALYSKEFLEESNAPMFSDFAHKLHPQLLKALGAIGYQRMTPVQHKVLTELPSMRSDCLVQAKTGTGKTIAYLLPALQSLLTSSKGLPRGQVGVLVMSPTRELATQIATECQKLTSQLQPELQCHTAYGGSARASNLSKFMNGRPAVLVATPGRLNDYLDDPEVSLKFADMQTLVLDEADQMLDAGFLGAVKQALRRLPPKKKTGWQGMCFSATIPDSVKDVASVVLQPGYSHLSTLDPEESLTISTVPQFSVILPQISDTFATLFALLKRESAESNGDFKAIVFGPTANQVAVMYSLFSELAPQILPGLNVFQIQSRLSQNNRNRTTEAFRTATSGVMFASDVVGRGLDFPNVNLIIQVGLPMNSDQYIHRVGRTARAGKSGRAAIILTQPESYFLHINRNKLPIESHPAASELEAEAANLQSTVATAFNSVDQDTKGKAYSAYLGFHKTFVKNLRTTNEGLVQTANDYAAAMGCQQPPELTKMLIGKMGLKGVRGLRIGAPKERLERGGGGNRPQHQDKPKRENVDGDRDEGPLQQRPKRPSKKGGAQQETPVDWNEGSQQQRRRGPPRRRGGQ